MKCNNGHKGLKMIRVANGEYECPGCSGRVIVERGRGWWANLVIDIFFIGFGIYVIAFSGGNLVIRIAGGIMFIPAGIVLLLYTLSCQYEKVEKS